MDENRARAYLDLINQLLNCPQGEEAELLQANQPLLDEGLLQTMGRVATQLEEQGNEGTANWLKSLAAQIAQTLGTVTLDTFMDSFWFLFNTFARIEQKPKTDISVYKFLEVNQAELSANLLIALPTIAANFYINISNEQHAHVAALLREFGDLIQQVPFGQKALNLEIAIIAYRQSLQATTLEAMPTEWAVTSSHLANAYFNRICEGRAENLEIAIRIYKQSLQVITQEAMPIDWATLMTNLGVAYRNRIRGNRAENLETAINAHQQSLTVRTREAMPIEWAQSMNNLAIAYSDRIYGDRAENIEVSIINHLRALEVRTKEDMPFEWATSMSNLANAYSNRICGDGADNIEIAIDNYEQALTVRTREAIPIEWAQSMTNLATAYYSRIRGDRAENIEIAIDNYEQALTVRTREAIPIEWAQSVMSLANSYCSRIRGDRAENIEIAIDNYEQALTVRTREAMPIEWAASMNNLATAYYSRIRGDRAANIESAIDAYSQSLTVRTRNAMPVEWAQVMNNLANAYSKRLYGDHAVNIEFAIDAYKKCLQVRTKEATATEWATSHMNLGAAYTGRIYGDRAENIEFAIDAYKKSLEIRTKESMPIDWATSRMNLGTACYFRVYGSRLENIETAINSYQQALEVFHFDLLPDYCRRTARLLGNLYAGEQRWTEAAEAYSKALQATEILYQSSLFLSSQAAELSETGDLFRRATYAYARSGDLQNAILTVEVGRARNVSDSLERDRADLADIQTAAPELYQQYQQAVETLRQLEIRERAAGETATGEQVPISPAELRQQAETARQGLTAAIGAIRQLPGYADFLGQPSYETITAAVQPEQPLVYLLPTPSGGLGLVAHRSASEPGSVEITPVWLDALTDEALQQLLTGSGEEMTGWFGAYDNSAEDRQAWLAAIGQTTRQLWDLLMQPVVTCLESLSASKAVLIPTSYLSFLPLHAAWTGTSTGRHYALDTITFTYAPNARSLSAARATAARATADSLLAVNEPRPTRASQLPNSEREIASAITYFPKSHKLLSHEQASRAAVLAALSDHSVFHFSCHGRVNFASPLESGLTMANDKPLSLQDFFELQLKGARLAILSACETGLSGTQLPDEVVSLPTGLLQAGVAGIAASLWSVADLSTMMLIVRFYGYWREDENLSPAEALKKAQIWLRDSSNKEKADRFGLITLHPEKNDYVHPYHWAAFTYVGA